MQLKARCKYTRNSIGLRSRFRGGVSTGPLMDRAAASQALSQELGSFARQVSARTIRRRSLQHGDHSYGYP
ncbi:hypothetical protein TNCV_1216881 [Trichonephila clavipes]|nr:hypothetical protein TNCV_1216881 [Trichonephila clavipes]